MAEDNTSASTDRAALLHKLWRKQIHKLNNSLAAIIGHSTLLSYEIPEDESMKGFIRNIREATNEAINVADMMGELEEMLRPGLDNLPEEAVEHAVDLLNHGKQNAKAMIDVTPPSLADLKDHTGVEHILLVEDDVQLRALLTDCLRELGYTVDAATNGKEGKEKFSQLSEDIDLVCVDFHLPFATGLEVSQYMRGLRPRLRIILLSGAPIDPEAPEFKQVGFDRILSKPLEVVDFAKTVRQVLNEDKAR